MATVDGGDVRFTFTGDSSDLNDSLKDIERNLESVADAAQGVSNDLGKDLKSSAKDAQSAAKGLESQTKKNARAFADTKKQTDAAAKSLERTSDAAGETDSILKGLAGALGIVSPEASAAATALGDAAGGLEAVTRGGGGVLRVLGPVALAVAAFGVAWKAAEKDLADAEFRMREAAKAAEVLQSAIGSRREFELTAELERQVALGEESAVVLEARNAQLKAESVFAAEISIAQDRTLATAKSIQSVREDISTAIERGAELRSPEKLEALRAREEALTSALAGQRDQIRALEGQTANLAATLLETAAAQTVLNERSRDTVSAVDEQAEAESRLAQQAAEAEKQRLAVVALKQAEARRVGAELANQEAAAEAAASAAAKRAAAVLAAEEANRQAIMATAGAYGEIGGAVSSLADTIAQGSEANKQAALVAFGVAKAAALAEGAVNVALSVTRAAAAAPPPANIPFIVAAAAQGAALIGGIAAQPPPQFPMGSFGIGAPTSADHQAVSIRQDEAILNSGARAELGDDTIRRLNRGQGAGGTTVQPVLLPGTVRGFVRDETRRSGALRSNGRRGNLSGNRGF